MKAKASWWLVLAALTVMWGSSYLLIEFALRGFTPAQLAGIRITLAAIVLLALTVFSAEKFPRDRFSWLFLAGIAIVGNCLPFMLIAWGQQNVESGLSGILVAITPLAVVALGHFFLPAGRLAPVQIVGFALGFGGVVLLMGPESLLALGGNSTQLLSQVAILMAALCYAISTVLTARMPAVRPLAASTGVMLIATLAMLPATLPVFSRLSEAPAAALVAVAILGIVGTAVTAVLYFWLVARAGARFTSLFNYLVPMWAVTLGVMVLDETVRITSVFALLLVIGGVFLTQTQSGRTVD